MDNIVKSGKEILDDFFSNISKIENIVAVKEASR